MGKAIGRHSEYQERIDLYQPSLVVFAGLPLTGKTTLARELSIGSNYRMIDVDEVRQQGVTPDQIRVLQPLEEKAAVEATYVKMFQLAESCIQRSAPVVMSGVFSRPQPYHDQLKQFINDFQIPYRFFYVPPPDENEVRNRLQRRLMSPDNRSNIKTYESFFEVQQRYNLIRGIDIDTIEPNSSIYDRMRHVRSALESLRLNNS